MISLKILRNETEMCKRLIASKQGVVDLEHVLILDKKLRQLKTISNEMRAERNSASEAIGKLKKVGKDASDSMRKTRELGDELKNIEKELHAISKDLKSHLYTIPNLPHESVPVGLDENFNVEIRSYGRKPEFNFEPKSHLDLGEALGLFDFQKGAKLSGSGFPLYLCKGATLERYLINAMIDHHIKEFSFKEVFPPVLMKKLDLMVTSLNLILNQNLI